MEFYRIYKARVIKIEETGEEDKPEIVVTPEDIPGETAIEKYANPPSFLPTSNIGSGVTSLPDIGQLCLVAETDSEYRVNILSYVMPNGLSPHGFLSGEPNSIGGFVMKVGALHKSVFSMDRSGRMTLYSDNFSRFEIDGSTSSIKRRSKSDKVEYAGGFVENAYFREDPTTGIEDLTTHQTVFTKNLENPGFTDSIHFGTEQVSSPPPISRYVDKAIIKAGSIINLHTPEERYNHVYQLETRQSTGSNRIDKDTVAIFRMGYQEENQRFSSGPNYPEGTILEWNAKRNTNSDNFLYWHRVGKIKQDLPETGVKGEFYRLQLLSDKKNSRAFGTPTINPTAEGEGWSTKLNNTGFLNQYSLSLGDVASGDYVGSSKREYLHKVDTSGQGFRLYNIYGGESLHYKKVEDGPADVTYEYNLAPDGEFTSWTHGDYSIDTVKKDGEYQHIYKDNNSEARSQLSSNGATIEFIKRGNTSIRITDEKIIMKTGDMELELSEDRGLVLNGIPLVYATMVDFLNQNRLTLGQAMGSPVPMSPGALSQFVADFNKGYKQNVGYKTGS